MHQVIGAAADRTGRSDMGVTCAGIHAFVRCPAKAEARNAVLADAIAPGPIDTPMLQGRGYTADAVPLARFGRPEEIATLAAYLVPPGATSITGAVVDANGGLLTS